MPAKMPLNIQRMIKLKIAGATYGQIAEVYGRTAKTVQYILRPPPPTRAFLILQADNKCQRCRKLINGAIAHVHHGMPDNPERWNDISNLEYLCGACHIKADFEINGMSGGKRKVDMTRLIRDT